jgi:hypothetical protein
MDKRHTAILRRRQEIKNVAIEYEHAPDRTPVTQRLIKRGMVRKA